MRLFKDEPKWTPYNRDDPTTDQRVRISQAPVVCTIGRLVSITVFVECSAGLLVRLHQWD